MSRDPRDESIRTHRQWLGYLQPVGLVVSPPALVESGCYVNSDVAAEYARFVEGTADGRILNLRQTLLDVFGWNPNAIIPGTDPRAADVNVYLETYDDHLHPTFAVADDPQRWLMLIQELPAGQAFDAVAEGDHRKWKATPHARFDRLLREAKVPTGLLGNGTELRLVYAPHGESTGHITFPVAVLLEPAGRLAFAALLMLLRESRIFGTTGDRTLADILVASRKYQNTVSTELAQQVLAALYELLRGFQAADAHRKGDLLNAVLNKLRGDAGRHPDTMDRRYGAWARLVALFRMVHHGAQGGGLDLPGRLGYLFNPEPYPFLEGRAFGSDYDD